VNCDFGNTFMGSEGCKEPERRRTLFYNDRKKNLLGNIYTNKQTYTSISTHDTNKAPCNVQFKGKSIRYCCEGIVMEKRINITKKCGYFYNSIKIEKGVEIIKNINKQTI
jgi:hypothetical protein